MSFLGAAGTSFFGLLDTTTAAAGNAAPGGSSLLTIGMLVLMFGAMYFLMIRPQKKKQKAEEQMRSGIEVGDEITTIGGIVGRVVSVKEDSLIIETGSDRAKMRVKRWAVGSKETKPE